MKQKILALVLILLFLPALLVPGFASETHTRIVDEAGLLTDSEISALETKAQSLMEQYGMDVVVLTVDALEGTRAQDVADDFYDHNGYGDDGVLFLLAMEEREWYISTAGNGIYALTDYGIQQVGFVMIPYLSEGDYYGAFDVYYDELPMYFDALEKGAPIDGYADYSEDYYHGDQEEVVYYEEEFSPSLLLSLVIGLVVAGISLLIMRASMNTKRQQHSAGEYVKAGSYQLHRQQDLFLYSNVSKVRRQQSSSSGGGSSVHSSSGGRSHGGGGGRF